jgi:two-component system, sensor histidine kinase
VADFRLGDDSGVAAIEALRSAHGDVPAVIISGDPDIGERGLPYPVLQKPVTPGELLDVLREASAEGC